MKQVQNFWTVLRRQSLVIAVSVTGIALYLYHLTSMPTGLLAPSEGASMAASHGLHALVTSPLFLPINVLRFIGFHVLPAHPLWALRLPSVGIALVTVGALAYITRRWYGQRTLYFSLALLLASAWLLHTGRLGTNDIVYVAVIPLLLAMNLLLHDNTEKKILLFLWATALMLLLYVPGIIWLVIATFIWQRGEVGEAFARFSWAQRLGLVMLCSLIAAPLVYGLVQQASIPYALSWLGLPSMVPAWQEPLKNLIAAVLFVFVRTPSNPALWLGRLPVFDAFLVISLIAGIFFYASHPRAERTQLLLMYGVLSLVLCALGDGITRSLLVPLVYLIAFGGIAYILHQWLKVFPRNPLARRLGIGLICAAVTLSALYGIRQYFIAWPHNSTTKQTFNIKP